MDLAGTRKAGAVPADGIGSCQPGASYATFLAVLWCLTIRVVSDVAIKLKIPAASAGSRNPLPRIVIAATFSFLRSSFLQSLRSTTFATTASSASQDERADLFDLRKDLCPAGQRCAPETHMVARADCDHAAPRRLPWTPESGADAPMGTFHMIPGRHRSSARPGVVSLHRGARILTGPDGRVERILGVGANSGADLGFL